MTLIAIAWKHTCEEISKSNPPQFWMGCSSPPDYIIFHWPHMLLSSVCFFCNNWSLYVQWSCPLKCFSQRVICFSVQGVILLTLFWIIQIAGFWKYTYHILLKAVGPSLPDFYLLPATVIGAKKHKSTVDTQIRKYTNHVLLAGRSSSTALSNLLPLLSSEPDAVRSCHRR